MELFKKLLWLLFSFDGRIPRSVYWICSLAFTAIVVASIVLPFVLWAEAIDTQYEEVWQQYCSGSPWELGPKCFLDPVQYRTVAVAEQEYLRQTKELDSTVTLLFILSFLAILWPSYAVGAKRMHDTGLSAWWLLLCLVPIVGYLLILWLGFMPAEETDLDDSTTTVTPEGRNG